MMKKVMLGLMLLATIIVVGCSGNNANGAAVTETIEEGLVKIHLDGITDQMQKFQYDADGIIVTYFAVKGSDGKIRTAFDACDVCGGYKGYSQQGNDIACNNCGRVFSIDGLGTKNKGYGCWPSYLSHNIEDGNVIIQTAELEAGKHRFA